MNLKKTLYSKKFLFFNLILIGIIAGFAMALFTFSCSTRIAPENKVYADDQPLTTLEDLEGLQNSFRNVAERVLPMVVQVDVIEIKKQVIPEGNDFPFFPWDFGPSEPDEEMPEEREFRNEGIGSGVIVRKSDNDFYVITNDHVIGEADEIKITLADEREFEAELVGEDPRKDLALLKFHAEDQSIPIAVQGNSDSLHVGDWVLAIGNPFGYNSTVTAGIVSAMGRRGPRNNISDFIQTDAAINQGNSGGALVNLKGELVGINTWITTPTGGNIGLGFAIPINNAKKAIDDLIRLGKVEYGWLGVSIADVLPSIAEQMNLSGINGAFIYHVFEGSPAAKGGMQPGDFVTRVDGMNIEDSNMLIQVVGDLLPDQISQFEIVRLGKSITLEVKIGLRQNAETIQSINKNLWPGLSVVPITEEIRSELNIPKSQKGLIVREVEPKTKLQIAGLKLGDILTKINNVEMASVKDFYQIINDEKEQKLRFHFIRENNEYNIEINR